MPSQVVHLVALPHDRVAVFLESSLLIVDGHSGADLAAALPLPAWPAWAAADGDRVLVRSGDVLMAIEVPARDSPRVLWRDASGPSARARHDAGPLTKCGGRFIDVVARRHMPDGSFADARALLSLRIIDPAVGVIAEQPMQDAPGFFDRVHFQVRCSDSGRVHVTGRFIILD